MVKNLLERLYSFHGDELRDEESMKSGGVGEELSIDVLIVRVSLTRILRPGEFGESGVIPLNCQTVYLSPVKQYRVTNCRQVFYADGGIPWGRDQRHL